MGDAEEPEAGHLHVLLPRAPVHARRIPCEISATTRVVSWNVNRRITLLAEQAAGVAERAPDVVALQEITPTSLPRWRDALAAAGLPHVVSSLDTAPPVREPPGPRRTGVLLAAREPLEMVDAGIDVPWPETVLSGATGGVELHVCHVPNARNGWIKVETLEGIHAALGTRRARPALLCGDFNTPRSERPDGTVITFARDRYGRLRPDRGERWDAAELRALTAIWPDAFRGLHGYGRKEISWAWPRFPRSGYRLDHLFTTLEPRRCEYLHDLRTAKLSDHSPLEADLG